jgi:hypothetical protein
MVYENKKHPLKVIIFLCLVTDTFYSYKQLDRQQHVRMAWTFIDKSWDVLHINLAAAVINNASNMLASVRKLRQKRIVRKFLIISIYDNDYMHKVYMKFEKIISGWRKKIWTFILKYQTEAFSTRMDLYCV